eukprot:2285474-Amphidinium_carterae.1
MEEEEMADDGAAEGGTELPVVKPMRQPHVPSPEEVALHRITHCPHRDWCRACVAGRGKQDKHAQGRQEHLIPELSMDYFFFGAEMAP